MENVVPKDHGHTVIANKIGPDDESLRQAVRAWLDRVGQVDAKLGAIPEERPKTGRIQRRGNDEDIPDPRLHEHRKGVINHGLVVNGEKLLGCHFG